MQLNSFGFFAFFAVVFAAYWALPARWRVPVLFVASMGFYACFGSSYLLLLLGCITAVWAGGQWLAANPTKARLRLALVLAFAPLALFKYFDFASGLLASALSAIALPVSPVLLRLAQPVGISYYTFQAVSYLVDIYRGKQKPEKSFFVCGLFLSFFPQIIAGPMTRPQVLAPQFTEERKFDYDTAIACAQLILLGLFKKMVVADSLAAWIGTYYRNGYQVYSGSLLLLALFYTIQIYADFSGYTDMARGFAGLLGIDLAENFRTPYLSTSIKEFWGRWHISLSSWLSEYLYIPLGGSRVSKPRHCFNLMVTFVLSGLWHGASLMMLLWGALHGVYMVVGTLTKPLRNRMFAALHWSRESITARIFSTAITFCLVAYAWIFFSAPTPEQGLYMATHLFTDFVPSVRYLKDSIVLLGLSPEAFLQQMLWIGSIFVLDLACYNTTFPAFLKARSKPVRIGLCYLLVLLVVLFGNFGAGEFIYFKF